MKKLLSYILTVTFSFVIILSSSIVPASAYDGLDKRIMPVPFTFTDSITVGTELWHFPPGTADFDVTITGQHDAQGDHVVSIDSASCVYRGGINCTEHDVEVVAWTEGTSRGYVFWRLEGTLTFTWTSPVSGMQYETVRLESPTNSFKTVDYTNLSS